MSTVNSETSIAIVNPTAGGGHCGRRAEVELQRLRDGGLQVESRRTSVPETPPYWPVRRTQKGFETSSLWVEMAPHSKSKWCVS